MTERAKAYNTLLFIQILGVQVAPKGVMDYARRFIRAEAQRNNDHRLNEPTNFHESLVGSTWKPRDQTDRTVGWFELDNGFMAFSDRVMFERAAAVFGIDPHVGPERTPQTDLRAMTSGAVFAGPNLRRLAKH